MEALNESQGSNRGFEWIYEQTYGTEFECDQKSMMLWEWKNFQRNEEKRLIGKGEKGEKGPKGGKKGEMEKRRRFFLLRIKKKSFNTIKF